MAEMKDYSIELVERTLDLLEKVQDEAKKNGLEVTFLMNLLSGLLVICFENKGGIFDKEIDDDFIKKAIPEKISFPIQNRIQINKSFDEEENIRTTKRTALKQLKQQWYINKLRNGIAHHNIEPLSMYGNQWTHVKIQNKTSGKSGRIDFEVEISIEQLKSLAVLIANTYLIAKKKQHGKK